MFRWCKKDGKGDCLGALKQLIGRRNVKVELRDGLMFIDEVMGIVEEAGAPIAVLATRRVAIRDIEAVELA